MGLLGDDLDDLRNDDDDDLYDDYEDDVDSVDADDEEVGRPRSSVNPFTSSRPSGAPASGASGTSGLPGAGRSSAYGGGASSTPRPPSSSSTTPPSSGRPGAGGSGYGGSGSSGAGSSGPRPFGGSSYTPGGSSSSSAGGSGAARPSGSSYTPGGSSSSSAGGSGAARPGGSYSPGASGSSGAARPSGSYSPGGSGLSGSPPSSASRPSTSSPAPLGGAKPADKKPDNRSQDKSSPLGGITSKVSGLTSGLTGRFGRGAGKDKAAASGPARSGAGAPARPSAASGKADAGGRRNPLGFLSNLRGGKKSDDKPAPRSPGAVGPTTSGRPSAPASGQTSPAGADKPWQSKGGYKPAAPASAPAAGGKAAAPAAKGGLGRFLPFLGKKEEKRPAPAKARAAKTPRVEGEGLSLDTKLDILGVTLMLGALALFFSTLSSTRGALTEAVNNFLSNTFGWGALAIPLAMLAAGVWLIARHFGEEAPVLERTRLVGVVVLYLGLLVLMQFVDSFSYEGVNSLDALRNVWLPISIARGTGGGWLGAQLYFFLVSNLTEIGAFFVLVGWLVVGLMLAASLRASELAIIIISIGRSFRASQQRRSQARAARAAALVAARQQAAAAPAVTVTKPDAGQLPAPVSPALPPVTEPGIPISAPPLPEPARPERSIPITVGGRRTVAAFGGSETGASDEGEGIPVPGALPTPVSAAAQTPVGPPVKPETKPAASSITSRLRGALPTVSRPSSKPAVPETKPAAAPPAASAPAAPLVKTGEEKPAATGGFRDRLFGRPAPAEPAKPATAPGSPPPLSPTPPATTAAPAAASASPAPSSTRSVTSSPFEGERLEDLLRSPARPPHAPVDSDDDDETGDDDQLDNLMRPTAPAGPPIRPAARPTPAVPAPRMSPGEADAKPLPARPDVPLEDRPFAPPATKIAASGAPVSAPPGSPTAPREPEKTAEELEAERLASLPPAKPKGTGPLPRPEDTRSRFGVSTFSGSTVSPARGAPSADSGDARPPTEVKPPAESKPTVEAAPTGTAAAAFKSDADGEGASLADRQSRLNAIRAGNLGGASPRADMPKSTDAPRPEQSKSAKPEDMVMDSGQTAAVKPPSAPIERPAAQVISAASPASAVPPRTPPAPASGTPPAPAAKPAQPAAPFWKGGDDKDNKPEAEARPSVFTPPSSPPAAPARPVPVINAAAPRTPEPGAASPVTTRRRKDWKLPTITTLLQPGSENELDRESLLRRARVIEDTLQSFGAPGKVVEVNTGPVITQFGVEPDYLVTRGGKKNRVKVGAIAQLDKDLQLALGAKSIRIEAPVPGKGYVGIEVPNEEASLVSLRDVMESDEFKRIDSPLTIALGQSVDGTPVAADLSVMPHLLIAGTTGSGKSVCVNAIITSLLLRNPPDRVKFIMVDPKRVELTGYNGIPHLVAPVVVDLERIVGVLKWVTREMDERYKRFSSAGARNIEDYNKHLPPNDEIMPYIIVIIDELADLMMLAPDETERVITRIAALARATGIHLVIATQRPSVDVVTGLIKANFPARIAFAVASSVDSRVILDQPGADRLLGRGDMLYMSGDSPAPLRLQGVYVSDMEINNINRYWKSQMDDDAPTKPITALILDNTVAESSRSVMPSNERAQMQQQAFWDRDRDAKPATPFSRLDASSDDDDENEDESYRADQEDELYEEAVEMVRRLGKASVSLLQRRLRIGYTRAARLIDLMEERGVVGPPTEGSKPREVLPRKP